MNLELIEVELTSSENFLKIAETLTRIGVERKSEMKLFQTCHILHKKGKYYIVHFKEMFLLDGKSDKTEMSEEDYKRRNRIVKLLKDWGFIRVVDESKIVDNAAKSKISVIPFKEKSNWNLISKYTVGVKKNEND